MLQLILLMGTFWSFAFLLLSLFPDVIRDRGFLSILTTSEKLIYALRITATHAEKHRSDKAALSSYFADMY